MSATRCQYWSTATSQSLLHQRILSYPEDGDSGCPVFGKVSIASSSANTLLPRQKLGRGIRLLKGLNRFFISEYSLTEMTGSNITYIFFDVSIASSSANTLLREGTRPRRWQGGEVSIASSSANTLLPVFYYQVAVDVFRVSIASSSANTLLRGWHGYDRNRNGPESQSLLHQRILSYV